MNYIENAVARTGVTLSIVDLVATLTELTIRTVARDLSAADIGTLVVSGGGWHNPVIMDGLHRDLPSIRIIPSDELDVPIDSKEAIAFALIGWFTAHGLPGTVPGCTGARTSSILCSITPGRRPLQLSFSLPEPPFALTLSTPEEDRVIAAPWETEGMPAQPFRTPPNARA